MPSPPSPLLQSFAQVLQQARLARGLSLQQVVEATDICLPHLRSMEAGMRAPTLSQLLALGQALGCEPAHLVARSVEGMRMRSGPEKD